MSTGWQRATVFRKRPTATTHLMHVQVVTTAHNAPVSSPDLGLRNDAVGILERGRELRCSERPELNLLPRFLLTVPTAWLGYLRHLPLRPTWRKPSVGVVV